MQHNTLYFDYRGFLGSIEKNAHCDRDVLYCGKILGIEEEINYTGESLEVLEKNFIVSVDLYIQNVYRGYTILDKLKLRFYNKGYRKAIEENSN